MEHNIDAIRAEDAFSSKLGYEEHIPGQTRDWNEELQTTRELPRKNLPERLLRERAIFKVHSDFVSAATRGAMAVIDGNVMAINPGEDPKMQMFIWNNIFFSLGFGARLLAPVMTSARAWRILDAGVGVLMWALAAGLLRGLATG